MFELFQFVSDKGSNFTDSHEFAESRRQHLGSIILFSFIPEQFTVIGPPSFI